MTKTSKIFLIILPVFLLLAGVILKLSFNKIFLLVSRNGCGCDYENTTGDYDPSETVAFFLNQQLKIPLAGTSPSSLVLGDVSPGEKWIEVDLSEQKLTAWEGSNKFLETLVSTGKWGRTPTGEFSIWSKFKYTKMSGGNKEDHTYYYLPNVPYTMYFFKGFGLHGTYWHNNFGQTMSHGCVNMPTVMAEKVFYWSTPSLPSGRNSVLADKDNPGTKVVVHE